MGHYGLDVYTYIPWREGKHVPLALLARRWYFILHRWSSFDQHDPSSKRPHTIIVCWLSKQGVKELALCVETAQTKRLHMLAIGKLAQQRGKDLCFAQP